MSFSGPIVFCLFSLERCIVILTLKWSNVICTTRQIERSQHSVCRNVKYYAFRWCKISFPPPVPRASHRQNVLNFVKSKKDFNLLEMFLTFLTLGSLPYHSCFSIVSFVNLGTELVFYEHQPGQFLEMFDRICCQVQVCWLLVSSIFQPYYRIRVLGVRRDLWVIQSNPPDEAG